MGNDTVQSTGRPRTLFLLDQLKTNSNLKTPSMEVNAQCPNVLVVRTTYLDGDEKAGLSHLCSVSQLFTEGQAVSLFLTAQGDAGGAEQNPGHRDWITKMTAEPSVAFKMGSP